MFLLYICTDKKPTIMTNSLKNSMLTLLLLAQLVPAMGQDKLAQADMKARQTLQQMTLDEKLSLIDGAGFDIRPIERLGIPKVHMSDGPVGVRQASSTAFPATVMLAATWNRQLAHEYGYALGRDSRARGVNIILGPAVNIYRSPLNARNFEYMGEDPYLAAQMAGAYIRGVQENPGVIACIKHFAANNPETDRYTISADVDERTMHEIYLPAFRHAVEKAKVGSIMSSYNRINGTWTAENRWLMHQLLRGQWQYPFLTMTDWGAAHHTDLMVSDGVDIEMPGGSVMTPEKVRPLIEEGRLTEQMIDEKVLNILRTCFYFDIFSHTESDKTTALDNAESAQTAYDVAAEGFVLLKNEDGILPIGPRVKRICLTGHNASEYVYGGGSSNVMPFRSTTPYDGLREACRQRGIQLDLLNPEINPNVTEQCCFADTKLKKKGFAATYYNNKVMEGTPLANRTERQLKSPWVARPVKKMNPEEPFSARYQTWISVGETGDYILMVGGDDGFRLSIDGERIVDDWNDGATRWRKQQKRLEAGRVYRAEIEYYQQGGLVDIEFRLCRVDPEGKERIRQQMGAYDLIIACEGFNKNLESEGSDRTFALEAEREEVMQLVARSGVPTIGVINAGGNVESSHWQPQLKGLVWAWYSGQEGGRALADMLFGKLSPSGKLPMTFERRAEDNPSFRTYSDQGHQHVAWTEGVFIGYRGYEEKGMQPLYPFGYGLSYTTFSLSEPIVSSDNKRGDISLSLTVTNTGTMAGAEVVQLYVGKDGESPVLRPKKELKNFEKVMLRPGEQRTVTLTLSPDDFKYYDVNTHRWVTDPGRYHLFVGTSSADIRKTLSVEIQ